MKDMARTNQPDRLQDFGPDVSDRALTLKSRVLKIRAGTLAQTGEFKKLRSFLLTLEDEHPVYDSLCKEVGFDPLEPVEPEYTTDWEDADYDVTSLLDWPEDEEE